MERAKILIVDDDESVLMTTEKELASEGFEVHVVLGARDALGLMEESSFDIVFTDLVLSGMDGISLCSEVKRRWPHSQVVLMSSHEDDLRDQEAQFMNAGGTDKSLRKPLKPGELTYVTKKLLQNIKAA